MNNPPGCRSRVFFDRREVLKALPADGRRTFFEAGKETDFRSALSESCLTLSVSASE